MSSSSQYISVRETAQILAINEKKVMDLIEAKSLQAYRIADKFLEAFDWLIQEAQQKVIEAIG